MIICSCSGVTDSNISEALAWMRTSDPRALITPGKIYRALGKAPRCGGCLRQFVDHMRSDEQFAVAAELRGLRPPTPAMESEAAEAPVRQAV
jgi:bacterioferritin-associated ferredoxin